MMNKLIKKGEAVNALYERSQTFTESMFGTTSECNVAKVVALECAAIVANIPTLDSEPVVRCKSCKHWGTGYIEETSFGKQCKLSKCMMNENGYCSNGEVKDEQRKRTVSAV